MLDYFDNIESDIEILFNKIWEFESIFTIMGAFILILIVIVIINAHKISRIEKRMQMLENNEKIICCNSIRMSQNPHN